MAMTYATITGKIVVPGTTAGVPGELHAIPLTSGSVLTFPAENVTTIGPVVAAVAEDGTLTPSLKVPTDVPDGTVWRLVFYPIRRTRDDLPVRMGVYEITGSTDIADLIPIDPTYVTPEVVENVALNAVTAEEAAEAAAASAQAALASASEAAAVVFADADAAVGMLLGARVPQQAGPKDYVAVYTVDASLPADVPAFRLYRHPITAAAAVKADKLAEASGFPIEETRSSGARWRLIAVRPGTYTQTVATDALVLPGHTAMIGLGSSRDDVVLRAAGGVGTKETPGASGAVVVVSGGSAFVSNMTVEHTGTGEFWHPLRVLNRDASGPPTRTVTFENVHFIASDDAPVDAQAVDATPGSGTFLLFHGCAFGSVAQPQAVNLVMGAGSPTDVPSAAVFADCHVYGNTQTWKNNTYVVYDLNVMEANMVGFVDQGESGSRGDRFVWLGGSWDIGTASNVDGVSRPVGGYVWGNATVPGSATVWQVDPLTPNVNMDGHAVATRSAVVPLLPQDGMVESETVFYGADVRSDDDTCLGIPPTSTSGALVSGRIYYVRVPVTTSMLAGQMSLTMTNSSGNVGLAWFRDLNGAPDTRAVQGTIFEHGAGKKTFTTKTPGFSRIPIRPGDKYVWLACATSNASARVAVSTSSLYTVKYEDGWSGTAELPTPGTLSNLTAGAAFPVPVLWPDASSTLTVAGEFQGVGSPLLVHTPSRVGARYKDLLAVNGAAEWIATGTSSSDWIVLLGETGEYDLSSYMPAGVTGTIKAWRSGSLATFKINLTSWPAGYTPASTLPTGFQPVGSYVALAGDNGQNKGTLLLDNGLGLVMLAAESGDLRCVHTMRVTGWPS